MNNQQSSMNINSDFLNQLETAVGSSPIIYIPHFHYNYIDNALMKIASIYQAQSSHISQKELAANFIYEYSDSLRKQVNFISKSYSKGYARSALDELLQRILIKDTFTIDEDGNEQPKDYKLFLLKGVTQTIIGRPDLLLLLQTFAEKYERGEYDAETTIILVDSIPVASLPNALADLVTVIDIPLPSREEIAQIVAEIPVPKYNANKAHQFREDLCRHLQGLQFFEIDQIIRSAKFCTGGLLTKTMIDCVLKEKQNIIKKNGIIEVCKPDVTFSQIGGLEVLIQDLERKSIIYHNLSEVQQIKMQLPKGVLIIGMPGCGKSMIAKAIADKFEVSLLRLDISRLMGKYVGESEENLRRALAMAEAAHPCVLWIDEIEKAFAGANGGGNDGDMLVQRMMGYFLTWMQEHKTAVYIVATANDAMRPEFMRKGRFDEVYFVDFPSEEERRAIFNKSIARYREAPFTKFFDFSTFTTADEAKVIKSMDQFAGAEIVSTINTVIERRYIDYVQQRTPGQEQEPKPLPINAQQFKTVIEEIGSSIMSKQGSSDADDPAAKTPIQKIRKMQEIYKFKVASKTSK